MNAYPSYEEPIYTSACYSDEISNRQRRAQRQRPKAERRREAYAAQNAAGFRIRISRKVLNLDDFKPELKVWIPFAQTGVGSQRLAERHGMGNLAITLFDTNQQPLKNSDRFESEEELKARLGRKRPQLFVESPPIAVRGTAFFGNLSAEPFIGLTFEPGFIFDELAEVREVVAPELALDRSHLGDHLPHVSLGLTRRLETAQVIQAALEGNLPRFVKFAPAEVSYPANR